MTILRHLLARLLDAAAQLVTIADDALDVFDDDERPMT